MSLTLKVMADILSMIMLLAPLSIVLSEWEEYV
jgi:hypothetical protein